MNKVVGILRSATVLLKAKRVIADSVSCLCFFRQCSSVLQCSWRSLEWSRELVILCHIIFNCVTTVKTGEILTMIFALFGGWGWVWGLCMLKMNASMFGRTCSFIYIAGSSVVFLFITFMMLRNW